MINNLQQRPASKRIQNQVQSFPNQRPLTRKINSQLAEKSYQMAKQHQSRQQYTQAIKHYAEAIMHNPLHYQSYCNVGIIYRSLSKYPQAILSYLRALSINPEDFKTLYNLGNVYRVIGNVEEAQKCYKGVIEKCGEDKLQINAYNNLGVCYKNIGRWEEAISCYKKVIQGEQGEEGYFNMGVSLIGLMRAMDKNKKGAFRETYLLRAKQAQMMLQKVVQQKNPRNVMAQVYLIQVKLMAQGEKEEVIKKCLNDFKQLLDKQKTRLGEGGIEELSRKIAGCLAMLNRFEESAKHYKDGVKQVEEQAMARKGILPVNLMGNQPKINNQYDPPLKNRQLKTSQKQLLKENPIKKQTTSKLIQPQRSSQKDSVDSNVFDSAGLIASLSQQPKFTQERSLTKEEVEQELRNMNERDQQQKRKQREAEEKQIKEKIDKILGQVQELTKVQQYHEALELLKKEAPPCNVLNQQKIIILTKLAQQSGAKDYASDAVQTYKLTYLMNSTLSTQSQADMVFRQPAASDGSMEMHKCIAECYTILQQPKNAIKHYQIINEWYESHHELSSKNYIESQSALSVNYESLGLFEEAINCYQKALRQDGKNFDLNYNLAGCYQEGGMIEEAVRGYEKCLRLFDTKNKEEGNQIREWWKEGDCLLNIGICYGLLRNQPKQLKFYQQAMGLFDSHCETLEQLLEKYSDKFLLDVYMQLANLYQQTLEKGVNLLGQGQKIKQKLLSVYLVLLEFNQCPDRQQIILNCGNILYQQKLYLNALEYYNQLPQNQAGNYLGLTYLKVGEFRSAFSWLRSSLKHNPNNSIFWINYGLVCWLFSVDVLAESENSQQGRQNLVMVFQEEFPCQCDRFFEHRYMFALEFIECLTILLSSEDGNRFKTMVQGANDAAKEVLKILRQDISQKQRSYVKKDRLNLRKFLLEGFARHLCDHQKIDQRGKQDTIQKEDILKLLKSSPKQNLQLDFQSLIERLISLKLKNNVQVGNYPIIAQTMLSLFTISNSKNLSQIKSILQKATKTSTSADLQSFLGKESFSFLSKQCSQPPSSLAFPISVPFQSFVNSLQQWQMKCQSIFSPLLQTLKNLYWTVSESQHPMPEAMRNEWVIPRCSQVRECDECLLKTVSLFGKIFDKREEVQKQLTDGKGSLKDKIGEALFKIYDKNKANDATEEIKAKPGLDIWVLTLHMHFNDTKEIEKFIEACIRLLQKQPQVQSKQGNISSVTWFDKQKSKRLSSIMVNNLIKIEFHLGQREFISEYARKALEAPIGIKGFATYTIETAQIPPFPGNYGVEWLPSFQEWKLVQFEGNQDSQISK